jgi:predicted transport protein
VSDLKLFRISDAGADELTPQALQVERSLQRTFEASLPTLLGVRFLATEYSTGPVHGGRIDTLGIDENNTPVIIEYKRALNENVINQGLFYLDWLLDHRREFQWLVLEVLGKEIADAVDWTAPRLVCVAGDFTRYDNHAVKQINRSIELIRYRRFGEDLLAIELVHVPQSKRAVAAAADPLPQRSDAIADPYLTQRIDYRLQQATPDLRDLWDSVVATIMAFGDDVQHKELKLYHAFKRLKNFVCLELYTSNKVVLAHLKLDPDTVALEPGFTRDMRGVGHFGTGDLQVTIASAEDIARAHHLLQRAYESN